MRATDHAVIYLLGSDALPTTLTDCAAWHRADPPRPLRPAEAATATHLHTAAATGARLLYLHADPCCDTDAILAAATGPTPALRIDLTALTQHPDPDLLTTHLTALSRLHGAPLLLGPFDTPLLTLPAPARALLPPTTGNATTYPPLICWGAQPAPPTPIPPSRSPPPPPATTTTCTPGNTPSTSPATRTRPPTPPR
ncbi:hypothetical protein [Nocardia terpenica]|uniref:Uncharacterized protein n=1 Tax=Nocardia terpenica TaxID=455432 RepID=A0A6G9ZDA1_9NOCA|nr:hypothetical protein [Nocardia terpenica]QIS23518.1 hypothetical protein F6W96_39735 [Nocardia terpenica]